MTISRRLLGRCGRSRLWGEGRVAGKGDLWWSVWSCERTTGDRRWGVERGVGMVGTRRGYGRGGGLRTGPRGRREKEAAEGGGAGVGGQSGWVRTYGRTG